MEGEISPEKLFLKEFSISDEEATKMNIPYNFNHYASGDSHIIIQKFCDFSKKIFSEILNTYDWEKEHLGVSNKSDLKKVISTVINPEKYIKDHPFISYSFPNLYQSENPGMKISIPGPGYLWDSIYHIQYLLLYCIKETKLYYLNYEKLSKDNILQIIFNDYDKIKIMGLAARIREKLPHGELRNELNDIVHCEEKKETNFKRKDKYKNEWSEETLQKSKEKILEIIKRYPIFRNLLDEIEDMNQKYEIDILYQMNKLLEQITIMNEEKLQKIMIEINNAGGTSEYIKYNEIGYKINYWEKEIKSQLFDEIVDHKISNNWGITWKQRRCFNINELKEKCVEKTLQKIRYNFEQEKRNIRITNKIK